MALRLVGMDNVYVSNIHYTHLFVSEIGPIVFVVISSAVTKGKKSGCLANSSRAESGARTILATHIIGHTKHSNIGFNVVPVFTDRCLGKGAKSHER